MIVSIMVMVLLCGCGDKKNESGNASIHSDWELVEYTINGQTENVEDDSFALKLFTADAMPAFSCPEGFRCEFSLNKKTHRGILTEEGNDKYRIDFGDSYKPFLAEITGDRLTLKNEKGNISIVFKVRQDASED